MNNDAVLDWRVADLRQALQTWLPSLQVEVAARIDSSNAELMRRVRAGDTRPVLLIAEQQSAARGRLGRQWQSGVKAGDALSVSLALPLHPRDWSGLSLVIGLAVAESLHPDIGLKWPNDLWWEDRKLAGILVETAAAPGAQSPRMVVIGVGLNLASVSGQEFSIRPVGLRELRPDLDAPAALRLLAPSLLQQVLDFEQTGFAPFRERFQMRDVLAGRPVTLSDGRSGVARGLAEDGALCVATDAGLERIHSSEISVRPQDRKQGA